MLARFLVPDALRQAFKDAFPTFLAGLLLAATLVAPLVHVDSAQADQHKYLLTAMQGQEPVDEWRVFPTPLGSSEIPVELDMCDTFYIDPAGGEWASGMASQGYTFQIFYVDGPQRIPLCQ